MDSQKIFLNYYDNMLDLFRLKVSSGFTLTDFEKDFNSALRLLLDHSSVTKEEMEEMVDPETKSFRPAVERFYLLIKSNTDVLSEKEQETYDLYLTERMKVRRALIAQAIGKEGKTMETIPEGMKIDLLLLAGDFEDEVLWNAPSMAFWWDFESYIHIAEPLMLLEEDEYTKDYDFVANCRFNRKYLKDTLKAMTDEIADHFRKHPDQNFVRDDSHPVICDGCDFAIEIRPDGKVLEFCMLA